AHKIRDRLAGGKADRVANKDAADVYRVMLAIPVRDVVARLGPILVDDIAGAPSREAVDALVALFGARASDGTLVAADALRRDVPAERVAAVCTGLVGLLQEGIAAGGARGPACSRWRHVAPRGAAAPGREDLALVHSQRLG